MKTGFKNLSKFIAVLVFLSGLLNISSVFWGDRLERLEIINNFLPLELSQASRTFTVLAGFFLLFLAWGLWQRRYRAWFLSLVILCCTFVFHLLKGLNYEEAIFLLLPIIVLLYSRSLFVVQSDRLSWSRLLVLFLVILLTTYLYTLFGFYFFAHRFSPAVNFVRINAEYQYQIFGIGDHALRPISRQARWFDNSVWLVNLFALIVIILSIFSRLVSRGQLTSSQKKHLRYLVLKYGQEATSYFALTSDKNYFFSTGNEVAFAYKVAGGVVVVLGSPFGPSEKFLEAYKEFSAFSKKRGWIITFLNIFENSRSWLEQAGFKLIKFGEEAVVPISDFSLQGPAIAEVRHCVTRMQRENVKYHWYTMDQVPWMIISDLEKLHLASLKKRGVAVGFSVDFYPLPIDDRAYLLAVYSARQELLAAFTFYPFANGEKIALDLMLRGQVAINSVVEAALAEALRFFKEKNIKQLSLGLANLSNEKPEGKSFFDQSLGLLYKGLNQVYGYNSLYKFKKKFMPIWESKYLALNNKADIPKVVAAIIMVHLQPKTFWQKILKRDKKD